MKAGVERVISDKMNWLSDHGYEVLLVTYEQGKHPLAFSLNPSIIHKDLDVRFFELGNYNLFKRFFFFILYRERFKNKIRHVIRDFCPDILITTTYQLKIADLILSESSQSLTLLESHIACYKALKSSEYLGNSILRPLARLYDSYFLNKIKMFDKLIVLTNGDANDWRKYVGNVSVIPNPVTFFPIVQPEKPKEYCRIISVGRLHEQKGFDLLINAFSLISDRCPEWHVDIYGSGDDEKVLRSLIAQCHLTERVKINSPIPSIYEEYAHSDFYVLSSRYEGFPLVLNEAMSCGTPCVAFRCKYGPEDAITDYENGILVDDGDVKMLATSILWMINNPEERKRMGISARKAAARYKKENIMQKWENVFSSK